MPPNSIILVHPDMLINEGIASILTNGGFTILAKVETINDLEQLATQLKPDIILIDRGYTAQTIRKVKNYYEGTIVVLAHPEHLDIALEATRAGAMGCLSLRLDANEFIQSLQTICMGSMVISGDMVKALSSGGTEKPLNEKDRLSGRERDILQLIGNGANNREIAETLVISEHTVKAHLRSILNKLNIRNRQQMAAYAVRAGIVEEYDSKDREKAANL